MTSLLLTVSITLCKAASLCHPVPPYVLLLHKFLLPPQFIQILSLPFKKYLRKEFSGRPPGSPLHLSQTGIQHVGATLVVAQQRLGPRLWRSDPDQPTYTIYAHIRRIISLRTSGNTYASL